MKMNVDLVQVWLDNVSYSHSQSKQTENNYKSIWSRFSASIGMTAEEIVADYEHCSDRNTMRKYSQFVRFWIGKLSKEGLTNSSIRVMVVPIKSFFKYNDLPLGHIPQAMSGTVYHNRDITKEEIVQIMAITKIREKAFFAVMAQSGLRPHTIKQLKLKHLEKFDKIPCKIEVPKEIAKGKYGSYMTFIGSDAIKYLKQYFAIRKDMSPESLLFCNYKDYTKSVNTKDVSRVFQLAAQKLEKSGALDYEIRKGKPSELRLYNLRKFFRKYANQMGFENVNYLMGHTVRGSDAHYKPQDPEFYRALYAEKAMPFLRLETSDPLETENAITAVKQENRELKEQIKKLENTMQQIYRKVFHEKTAQEEHDLWLKEHPEYFKQLEEQSKEIDEILREEEEYYEKHPEERKKIREEDMKCFEDQTIQDQEKWLEEEQIRLDERTKIFKELQDMIKEAKKTKK